MNKNTTLDTKKADLLLLNLLRKSNSDLQLNTITKKIRLVDLININYIFFDFAKLKQSEIFFLQGTFSFIIKILKKYMN